MDLSRLFIVTIVCAANLVLALAVYVRNGKSRANRAFAAAVLVIVCWLILAFLSDQPLFRPQAVLLNRLTLAGGLLMGGLLLYFVLVFPQNGDRVPTGWRILLGVGLVLVGLTVFTDTIVADVKVRSWGTDVVQGPMLPYMALWAVFGVVGSVFVLTAKYRRAVARQRAQLKYMLLGVALFAITSVILGLVLPMVTGTYKLASLNTFSTLLLVGFTAYAMIKHRLMDIRLVVLRGAAYTALVAVSGASFVLLITLIRASFARSLSVNPNVLFFIAGLVVIFGFQPVRYILEHATDRFFYRRTYDPDQLLTELSTAMASTVDLDEIAGLIANMLKSEMKLTFAVLAYDDDDSGPGIVATHAAPAPSDLRQLRGLWSEGTMLLADDLDAASKAGSILSRNETRVLVPLALDHTVIGAMLLGPKQSGEMFTALDVQFLRILAPEAAIAIKKAQLFHEKNQRVRELTALNQLAFALGENMELDSVLNSALEQVVAVTKADSGSIMLLNEAGTTLKIEAAQGLPRDVITKTRIDVGEGIAGWVAKTKEALILVDGMDPRFKKELKRDDIVSAITVPLICKDRVIGVLSVNRKESLEFFTKENLNVVTSFAGQLAVTIENAKLYGDLENTFLGTITALAAAVDAKDPHTYGHSNTVTAHAVAIAEKLGLSEREIQTVRVASTLHDIGKIGIDGAILHKPEALSAEEREAVNGHPTIGANILASLDFLQETVPLILFHHERYAGGGYPSGVSGAAIPLGARIISVADSFNAMVSDRPYRRAMSVEVAVRELKDNSGTQFDPVVVEAFVKVLAEEGHTLQPVPVAQRAGLDPATTPRTARRVVRPTRRPSRRPAGSSKA